MKKILCTGMLLWVFPIMFFWFFGRAIYPIYFVLFLYGWYPIASLALGLVIGKSNWFGKWRWIVPLGIAYANAWGYPLTFGICNMMTSGRIHIVELSWIVGYGVCSYLGFGVGILFKRMK